MKAMINGLLGREREIIRLLNLFLENKLEFIVVGGYAISTYKKRFSIDLDLIIQEKELQKVENLLTKEGYLLNYEKKIEFLYGANFKRFMKKIENLPVNVDLLINGLASRTTDSIWSFDYVKENSIKRKLDTIKFLTPNKELIIAMKFHSGRLSDIRDIVALIPCNEKELRKHLLRGDIKKLKKSIEKQFSFLEKPQFDDSFKGIFGVHVYKEKDVEEARKLVRSLLKEM